MPKSAFGDLAAVRALSCRATAKGVNILIEGGDASTSWSAKILVVGDQVISRKVADGEMAEDDFEETRYVVRTPAD